ncbi:MAG: flippase-like domain-containing protein [Anaerolineales bacterium]|nr:flippase-like domain-containing protein [Anaerolineales bacterium]NUQ84030.1 flippase-like domain-containing protein [Anaerolineales bacterium]
MRKFLFILVLFLGAAFVYLSFGEIEIILETLQKGNLWFVLLGVLFQGAWFLVAGSTYLSLYRVLGMDGTVFKLSLMAVAANFVNIVAPSAGMSGMAVFISDANRNGQSPGKVTIVNMLYLLFDYIAFLFVLMLGLIVLFRRNDLDPTEIAASAVIFIIAFVLAFLLYLGSRSAAALGSALAWMARLVNRLLRLFIHREYLSETRAHEFAHEMATDLKSLPQRPRSLLQPLALAFANKALMMGILIAAFLSFQVPFSAGTIIGGFAISYLFLIVSPTPSGIGIVEGIMPLALSSLRVPWSQAVIITLAYRGITFWFPLGVGTLALRFINRDRQ